MRKIVQTPKEKWDEPKNPELAIQKQIRERKENPTVKEKLQEITFNLTKDLSDLSSKREKEINQIRQSKSPQKKNHSMQQDAEVFMENSMKHSRGVLDSVVGLAAGKSDREQDVKNIRQKKYFKNKGRELFR